jgi:hypothetical protein
MRRCILCSKEETYGGEFADNDDFCTFCGAESDFLTEDEDGDE